ncbi:PDZ domain-containing protein [Paenibacillus abyssi]|uniref:Cell division topological determinant MinJ n=1 Tax=Paenibacillus abyssi TaxID=1340531 RepID=A0A917D1H8_9BACL|nr:PDZ domain-containing protein [Paenibacillus abyssi]GGG06726.1 cell division topological determinant MinJ [Paenibacillus abyssi]
MDIAMELLRQAGTAALQLLIQPFYYIAVLLIVLLYFRQTRMERKLFHVRLQVWPILLVRTLVSGLAAGIVVSLAAAFIGVMITPEAIYWIWGMAAILVLFRVRFLCFAYSVGLLGILQWLIGWFDLSGSGEWIKATAESLASLDIPGLLLLVALMHAAESLLLRRQGSRIVSPMFLEGKRGRLVGGFQLQGYWPVPLLLLVPAHTDSAAAALLPWTPLFGGDIWAAGFTMIGLPMVIGFSEVTRSLLPGQQVKQTSKGLLFYSLLLILIAGAAAWWPPLTLTAALCALLLHEAMVWISSRREAQSSPLYVHDDRGLRVLAVVPGTPADELGIMAGEILYKVNGHRVRTKEELYEALHENSAFCKLEVLNHEGQIKFMQRARFAGEHHQLGVILAPDERADYYAASKPASLLDVVRRERTVYQRDSSSFTQ